MTALHRFFLALAAGFALFCLPTPETHPWSDLGAMVLVPILLVDYVVVAVTSERRQAQLERLKIAADAPPPPRISRVVLNREALDRASGRKP